jgi:hypothetical protein
VRTEFYLNVKPRGCTLIATWRQRGTTWLERDGTDA